MKKIILPVLLLLVTGCASREAIAVRDLHRDRCAAGDELSCNDMRLAQNRVDQEASDNAKVVLGSILLGVVAGIADSQRPTYVFVRRCRFC